jgi:hypothetical protein
MRKRIIGLVVAVLAVIAVVTTLSIAAGVKQYQFTGTVTEVDPKAKLISVDKGGDIWEFSTAGVSLAKVKKGDKVTVYYQMVAKKLEMK